MSNIVPVRRYAYDGIKVNVPIVGEVDIPVKVRITGRFIPDITFDPSKKSPYTGVLAKIIQPKVYILIGNQAFEIDYEGNVRSVSPDVFNQPTFFDELRQTTPEAQLLLLGLGAWLAWKIVKCIL